ncbi:hypothetical protein ACMX0H_004546, partial [Salmonella enterica subsp. diarizonae]|nr:hypothetical protein [Salmonella enterica]EAR1630926.1 hypothetical protein [Salmonella enterica]EAR3204114.1 hypothetical protein [Salmonella enterica]MFR73098.1 hypothetical protein [Salmonella enterica]
DKESPGQTTPDSTDNAQGNSGKAPDFLFPINADISNSVMTSLEEMTPRAGKATRSSMKGECFFIIRI